jgi:hypothetical protein
MVWSVDAGAANNCIHAADQLLAKKIFNYGCLVVRDKNGRSVSCRFFMTLIIVL